MARPDTARPTGSEPVAQHRTTWVQLSSKVSAFSTRIDASWTFRSKKSAEPTPLPISTVRFTPNVTTDGKVTTGKTASVPVTVQGAAADWNLKSPTVYVSYDDD